MVQVDEKQGHACCGEVQQRRQHRDRAVRRREGCEQQTSCRLHHRISGGYRGRAVPAPAEQQQPRHDRDVVPGPDRAGACRAGRPRPHDRGSHRDPAGDDVEEGPDHQTENAHGSDEQRAQRVGHTDFIGTPVPGSNACRRDCVQRRA